MVIPCFNSGSTLSEAIESALAQTYQPLEVVVVDDGSTDGSGELAARYEVRVVRQENTGLSAARNAGVSAAAGDLLLFLDADDVLHPECVERRVARLADDVGIVTGHCRYIDADGAPLGEPSARPPAGGSPLVQAIRANYGPPSGWLVRRRAIELCGGFDPLLASCEDWDFFIRICARYRFFDDPKASVDYRLTPGSMSRNSLRMVDTGRMVLRKARILGLPSWRYFLASQAGMLTHLAGSVFSRVRTDGGMRALFGLVWKRPALAWYLLLWLGRFAKNRLLGRRSAV